MTKNMSIMLIAALAGIMTFAAISNSSVYAIHGNNNGGSGSNRGHATSGNSQDDNGQDDNKAKGSTDSSGSNKASTSPKIPVTPPVNTCGNSLDSVGGLNPSFGNHCQNEG